MTTIRPATVADVPAIASLAVRFGMVAPNAADHAIDHDKVAALATRLMASADGAVFVAEAGLAIVGIAAFHVYAHPFSAQRVASQIIWRLDAQALGSAYARGRAALAMFACGERWARTVQADVLQVVAPTDDAAQFYTRRGFALFERAFQRRL